MRAEEIEEIGLATETSSEMGWTACGVMGLADEVSIGIISLEEAIDEILTKEELKILNDRVRNYARATHEGSKNKSR